MRANEARDIQPSRKAGKPFTLAPMKLEDALCKILASPPEPKPAKTIKKKPAKRK